MLMLCVEFVLTPPVVVDVPGSLIVWVCPFATESLPEKLWR